MATVYIGYIIAVVMSKQRYLPTHRIKCRLDEWCWVEQLLLVGDYITLETLAIGQTAPTRSGDNSI